MKYITVLLVLFSMISVRAQDDVDTRIPVNDQMDNQTFVVIISNEHYKYEQDVPYALNDGETFKLYCEKTLGVPSRNIRYVADATLNEMRMQFEWLQKVLNAYSGTGRAFVYYSGHGMPSDNGSYAYLLPVDGNSTLHGSGLKTVDLYSSLGKMPSRQTIVLLDACFSGALRDGNMLSSSRGVAIKVKPQSIEGNMVVFSAAQSDQTAYPLNDKKHGLFTYFLLEQLNQKGGCVSLGDLSDYVTTQVKVTSLLDNNKEQTPEITASSTAPKWRSWPFASSAAKRYEMVERKKTIIEPSAVHSPVVSTPVASEPENMIKNLPMPPSSIPFSSKMTNDGMTLKLGNVSFKMIRVEGGSFMMGASKKEKKEALDDEIPAHEVYLSSYYIGETEVTQGLWETVTGNNPSAHKGFNLPVEQVSWSECQIFIH